MNVLIAIVLILSYGVTFYIGYKLFKIFQVRRGKQNITVYDKVLNYMYLLLSVIVSFNAVIMIINTVRILGGGIQ